MAGALWGIEALPILLLSVFLGGLAFAGWRFGGQLIGFAAHTPAVLTGFTLVIGLGKLTEIARKSYRSRVVRSMCAEGLCPSCGHGVRNVPSKDGRLRCPECGSVWLAHRFDAGTSGQWVTQTLSARSIE